ncbi:MAG: thioredoxin domain-containing protein [Desulfoprunum sp.]|jgi:uncharacterized protein YyaL (SSP411 family)|uniref:thioredoxin domain-containing protein n=1 Tax=Desulfoprunum sp. TaxID=2020866 RepID=UPI003C775BD2
MNHTRKANRLINEKSPYLLQHAYNPVDWQPWSDAVLERAREEDRPIFLSIGYSTCHWCHVMAHESFEDEAVAARLNRFFIPVKVDREERPDLDRIYMTATQAMTGSGGWPLSIFLLPDGQPFFAGTYFPPQAMADRPSFTDILTAIERAWREDRGRINDSAARITAYLRQISATGPAAAQLAPDLPHKGLEALAAMYDRSYGGFGSGNKFPQPAYLELLLRSTFATGDSDAMEMLVETLNAMTAGGIYDHIGGGFHRYAVDRQWRVPHFEKMLYDQAQLAAVLLDASLVVGNPGYAATARATLDYCLRDLRRHGGFFSAEDADSENPYNRQEHGEGAFYLWQEAEIDALLAPAEAVIFKAAYGVEPDGNAFSDPAGEFSGRNILYRAMDDRDLARRFDRSAEEIAALLDRGRQTLLQRRSRRTRPHLDDKVITAWNGLMLSALAKGCRILDEPRYLKAAEETADFLLDHLVVEGRLKRRWRDGEARFDANLEDYIFLIQGLIDLYAADHRPLRLQQALDLAGTMVADFADPAGGFFDTPAGTGLITRMKDRYDGAEPSGNSVAALVLLRLARLTGDTSWQELGRQTIRAAAATLKEQPAALPLMLAAQLLDQGRARQVIIAGYPDDDDTRLLLGAVNHRYLPDTTVLVADGARNQDYLATLLPFIAAVGTKDGRAVAQVCEGFSCRLETGDAAELARILGQ